MNRIAPPPGERVFSEEASYLRSVLRGWREYSLMDDGSKRAFLWQLGTWQEYRDKVMLYRIPPRLDNYPYKPIADRIDMLIADMLAECANLKVLGHSVEHRLSEFEEDIRKLDAVKEQPRIWY